jgi:hypothetical protein
VFSTAPFCQQTVILRETSCNLSIKSSAEIRRDSPGHRDHEIVNMALVAKQPSIVTEKATVRERERERERESRACGSSGAGTVGFAEWTPTGVDAECHQAQRSQGGINRVQEMDAADNEAVDASQASRDSGAKMDIVGGQRTQHEQVLHPLTSAPMEQATPRAMLIEEPAVEQMTLMEQQTTQREEQATWQAFLAEETLAQLAGFRWQDRWLRRANK